MDLSVAIGHFHYTPCSALNSTVLTVGKIIKQHSKLVMANRDGREASFQNLNSDFPVVQGLG